MRRPSWGPAPVLRRPHRVDPAGVRSTSLHPGLGRFNTSIPRPRQALVHESLGSHLCGLGSPRIISSVDWTRRSVNKDHLRSVLTHAAPGLSSQAAPDPENATANEGLSVSPRRSCPRGSQIARQRTVFSAVVSAQRTVPTAGVAHVGSDLAEVRPRWAHASAGVGGAPVRWATT